jgi:divalent metal cation (Fe/Co/Zn/Cd) transporter
MKDLLLSEVTESLTIEEAMIIIKELASRLVAERRAVKKLSIHYKQSHEAYNDLMAEKNKLENILKELEEM